MPWLQGSASGPQTTLTPDHTEPSPARLQGSCVKAPAKRVASHKPCLFLENNNKTRDQNKSIQGHVSQYKPLATTNTAQLLVRVSQKSHKTCTSTWFSLVPFAQRNVSDHHRNTSVICDKERRNVNPQETEHERQNGLRGIVR